MPFLRPFLDACIHYPQEPVMSVSPIDVFVDVTNTLSVPFNTGIQRVTRELLRHLTTSWPGTMCFHPICYSSLRKEFRHLTPTERHYVLGYRAGDWLHTINSLQNKVVRRLPVAICKLLVMCMAAKSRQPKSIDWQAGSCFLDLDSAWHSLPARSALFPRLQEIGVHLTCIHYDLIPVIYPGLAHPINTARFRKFIEAHLSYTELFICISETVARDLRRYQQESGTGTDSVIRVMQLGADHMVRSSESFVWPVHPAVQDGNFMLSVGTVEPRKNFSLLLDLFEKLQDDYPWLQLVIVGRAGWNSEALQQRLHTHPQRNKRVFWLEGIEDSALHSLYQRARFVVVSSLYEGFGLPVVEALVQGSVVVSSNRGALPEAGRDYAVYFDPDSIEDLESIVRKLIEDARYYGALKARIQNYRVPRWETAAEQMITYLSELSDSDPKSQVNNSSTSR